MEIEKHIKHAQAIFIDNKDFDTERIEFINNLETCDLLAVPGSGKTTALLAKLYCLSQNLPFSDNSGILILSHTNQAVDEIENKLKRDCPKLFDYPNFSGTVQSFVNRFLANQACFEKHGSYIRKNDDDLIHDIILKRLKLKKGKAYWFLLNIIKAKFNKIEISYLAGKGLENVDQYLKKLINLKIINNKKEFKFDYDLITSSDLSFVERKVLFDFNNYLKGECENDSNWLDVIKTIRYNEDKDSFSSIKFKNDLKIITDSGKELKEIFDELRINGNLRYYDSFQLGSVFLKENPVAKEILQKRFKYVFIDEMQDLEELQIKIIDDIFLSNGAKTIIQRIGDINQSIYSGGKEVKVECDWKPRNVKYLNNSYRLTKETASLVNGFTLDPQIDENLNARFVVKGLNILQKKIKPHLILFDKNTTGEEIHKKFENLIYEHKLNEDVKNLKNGFKIIGWSTIWKEDENGTDKIRLKDLFINYSKESRAKKENFDCLKKHLHLFDQNKQTLESARKSILNALVRILSIESIHKDKLTFRYYRKSTLMEFIKNKGEKEYDDFKQKIFIWSFNLATKKDYKNVYDELRLFIESEFIKWNWNDDENYNSRTIEKSKDFIESKHYEFSQIKLDTSGIIKEKKDFEIEINSVHSVKGQTHCATMYIETAYKTPVYETNKLFRQTKKNPLFFINHDCNKPTGKEALKMMYVGFSRPTHLLCFAVLEENVKKDLDELARCGWKIEYDLINKN
ncbi:UvrD-helicase domain-containing protein [Flavobacterium sp.]|uniref:UvrD-helicase domain-containing protein n=1 Tax=Flavobacterium sp. TaxID=239 RepID=UPI002ED97CCF